MTSELFLLIASVAGLLVSICLMVKYARADDEYRAMMAAIFAVVFLCIAGMAYISFSQTLPSGKVEVRR